MTAIADRPIRRQRILHQRRSGPIAVATSGRDGPAALIAAGELARRAGTTVVVITAVEPVPMYGVTCEVAPLQLGVDEERRAAAIATVRNAIATAAGTPDAYPLEVRFGHPSSVIVRAARECGARLLVMASGSHEPFDRFFGDEETLQVMRRAELPVLSVDESLTERPRTIVAGVDFSPASVRAAQTALSLLEPGGTLHLVHVWRPPANVSREAAAMQLEQRSRVPEMLDRVEQALDVPPAMFVTSACVEGDPVEELAGYAQECGATVIAAGRHSRPWYERLLVGSTAARLVRGVRGAHCSVLLEPEPDFAIFEMLERHLAGEAVDPLPEPWEVQLATFTRRNEGRPTRLAHHDRAFGAQAQEVGFRLLGAAYDRRDGRVGLMLAARGGRLTRMIDGVTNVTIRGGSYDQSLELTHGSGRTVLTFLEEQRSPT